MEEEEGGLCHSVPAVPNFCRRPKPTIPLHSKCIKDQLCFWHHAFSTNRSPTISSSIQSTTRRGELYVHREKSMYYKTKQILPKLEEEPPQTGGRYSQCSCDYVSESFLIFSTNSENSCMGSSKNAPLWWKQWNLAEILAVKVEIPLFTPFVLPTHFHQQVGRGTWLAIVWLLPTVNEHVLFQVSVWTKWISTLFIFV